MKSCMSEKLLTANVLNRIKLQIANSIDGRGGSVFKDHEAVSYSNKKWKNLTKIMSFIVTYLTKQWQKLLC